MILAKTLVGDETSQDTQLFSQLWREASAAQANLGQLPVSEVDLAQTLKFVNQVGAYAQTLGVQTAGGLQKTEEQWNTLNRLYKQSQLLNDEIHQIGDELSSGRLLMGELRRARWLGAGSQQQQNIDAGLRNIDANMQQFPALIYDGPFSDHLEEREPVGLKGGQITAEKAKDIALSFIDKQPDTTYETAVVRQDRAKIPIYRVEITPNNDQKSIISVGVTQQAGKILWMLGSREVANAKLSVLEAGDQGALFLRQRGFDEMERIYYENRGNIAVFNFAATQGEVILYPDQIKVSVALDNGQIIGIDASNYWLAHKNRQLPQPRLTEAQAKAKLSPKLEEISPGRLALIPKTVDREELTYEFQGSLGNDIFLIYIDAVTGEEEKVLRVIKTDKGILTM